MITKQFLKIWLLSVNIINFKEILLVILILRRSRINEERLQNLQSVINVLSACHKCKIFVPYDFSQ